MTSKHIKFSVLRNPTGNMTEVKSSAFGDPDWLFMLQLRHREKEVCDAWEENLYVDSKLKKNVGTLPVATGTLLSLTFFSFQIRAFFVLHRFCFGFVCCLSYMSSPFLYRNIFELPAGCWFEYWMLWIAASHYRAFKRKVSRYTYSTIIIIIIKLMLKPLYFLLTTISLLGFFDGISSMLLLFVSDHSSNLWPRLFSANFSNQGALERGHLWQTFHVRISEKKGVMKFFSVKGT